MSTSIPGPAARLAQQPQAVSLLHRMRRKLRQAYTALWLAAADYQMHRYASPGKERQE